MAVTNVLLPDEIDVTENLIVRYPDVFVHPKAHVGNARIGWGTKIWQFASVIRNANIGKHCKVASCAIVDGSRLGDRVIVSHGAFIDPGMRIGNDVFIGPHVALCNDFWPRVDKSDWFDMDDLIDGKIVVTWVGDGASIGANAVVLPGLTIGAGAMIAAGAVVTQDVKDGHLYKRDGSIVPIDPAKTPNRMRRAA